MIETSSGLPRKFSAIFYNLGNFWLSSEILKFRKSSESGRKSSEYRQKRRYQYGLTREILFLALEHKIHIFSPSCNILYLFCALYLRDSSHKLRQLRRANEKIDL